jgi:hypothetical protein
MAGEERWSLFGFSTPEEVRSNIGKAHYAELTGGSDVMDRRGLISPTKAGVKAGTMLGDAFSQAAGYEAPEVVKARVQQQIMSSIDPNLPQEQILKQAARKFQQAGMYGEATKAAEQLREIRLQEATIDKTIVETGRAKAQTEDIGFQQGMSISKMKQQAYQFSAQLAESQRTFNTTHDANQYWKARDAQRADKQLNQNAQEHKDLMAARQAEQNLDLMQWSTNLGVELDQWEDRVDSWDSDRVVQEKIAEQRAISNHLAHQRAISEASQNKDKEEYYRLRNDRLKQQMESDLAGQNLVNSVNAARIARYALKAHPKEVADISDDGLKVSNPELFRFKMLNLVDKLNAEGKDFISKDPKLVEEALEIEKLLEQSPITYDSVRDEDRKRRKRAAGDAAATE